jgi:hypothetical protein
MMAIYDRKLYEKTAYIIIFGRHSDRYQLSGKQRSPVIYWKNIFELHKRKEINSSFEHVYTIGGLDPQADRRLNTKLSLL